MLKLSGAWLCGLSSIPQGSGLARVLVLYAKLRSSADTGKLLNYRQLMRSTKYREAWSLSSASKFGRLANGIGGRIKKSHQHY
jgi:hypothetical protein